MQRKLVIAVKVEMDRLKEAIRLLETLHGTKEEYYPWSAGKHTAAVRRASMDLTRALADLRR